MNVRMESVGEPFSFLSVSLPFFSRKCGPWPQKPSEPSAQHRTRILPLLRFTLVDLGFFFSVQPSPPPCGQVLQLGCLMDKKPREGHTLRSGEAEKGASAPGEQILLTASSPTTHSLLLVATSSQSSTMAPYQEFLENILIKLLFQIKISYIFFCFGPITGCALILLLFMFRDHS